jgi:galactose oxidase
MVERRWYPTVTLLGDPFDRVLVSGGTNTHDSERTGLKYDYDTDTAVGGYDWPNGPQALVQVIDYKKPPAQLAWTSFPPLNRARFLGNAVILADGSILKLGGRSNAFTMPPTPEVPELQPELYWLGNWHLMPPEASPRTYHSSHLLLSNGKVISASGDTRTWDYQSFSPHYLTSGGARPQFAGTLPAAVGYNTTLYVEYQALPAGVSIAKVALIAPGATTHHSDQHIRWIELAQHTSVPPTEGFVAVRTPLNKTYAPRGYYMIVLITNLGIPSVARWIQLV